MKKLLFAFCAAIVLFTGCQNDSSDDAASVQISLKERINTASDGDVIDLGKANLKINENDSYTISKPLTIKNGNVKNATFTVESDKVVFDSLMSINGVIVHERVGDGDFTLQNCYKVSEVYVNGGGSNSIHIAKTIVEKLIVNKKGVRVALSNDGSSRVTKTMIFEDCKLDSKNENNSFEKVIVEKAVKNLNLAGKTKVERIVSTESSGSESPSIKIIVSVEVKVVAADSTVKKSIEKTDGNEEFNKKESAIEDTEISTEEKADLEKEQEKVENPGASEKPGETEKPETPALENLDFIVASKDKISEKLDAFPDFAVGTISEIKVEKTSSEVIVTNSAASEDYSKIWDYWLVSKTPVKAEKGKNYKISFDLKADKSSRIYLATLDAATSEDSKCVEYNVGTEYKTYSVETGTALTDWSAGVSQLVIGSVSRLYIKNYKIEETDPKIGYAIFISDKNDSISCEASADDISVTFGENGKSGINIYPLALEVGKLHKVTFDVTCDKEVSDVAIFARANSDECATAGSEHFDFNTEKKTVTLYVPVYQKNNETLRTLLVWVDSKTPCKLTFSNFNSVETDLNSVLKVNRSLGLYFAGDIYLSEAEGKLWRVLSADRPIQLSPGSRVEGQVLLCDYTAWDSVVTSFRMISKDSEATRENENIIFSNNSSKTVSLSFSINDKLEAAVACAETELPDCLWIVGFVSESNAAGDFTREKFKVIDANTQEFKFKYDAEKHTGWGSKRGTIFFKVCADETGWRLNFGGKREQELSVSLNGGFVPLYASGVGENNNPGNIVVKNLADAGDYVITVVYNASVGFMKLKIEGDVYEWPELPELPPLKTGWYYYDINKSDLGDAGTFNILFNKENYDVKSQSANIEGLSVDTNRYWYDCWQEPDVSGSVLHGVSNPSVREDNPEAAPADGYIRIYFYSTFSDPGNLNLHYWTVVEPVFATKWPGVKMIEFQP